MTSRRRRDAGGMSAAGVGGDRLTPAGGWLPLSNREPLSRPGHYDDAPEQAHQSQDALRLSHSRPSPPSEYAHLSHPPPKWLESLPVELSAMPGVEHDLIMLARQDLQIRLIVELKAPITSVVQHLQLGNPLEVLHHLLRYKNAVSALGRLLSAIEVRLVLSRQVHALAVLVLAPHLVPFPLPWLLLLQSLFLLHKIVTFGRHNYSKILAKQLNLRHAMGAVRR